MIDEFVPMFSNVSCLSPLPLGLLDTRDVDASGLKSISQLPHEVPDRPWAKLGPDIFTYNGTDHILVVDYFSKYPKVVSLRTKTAQEIINKLKSLFARHGVPDMLVSDNMPYASQAFRQFAADWNFNLVTSGPTYPQSNG